VTHGQEGWYAVTKCWRTFYKWWRKMTKTQLFLLLLCSDTPLSTASLRNKNILVAGERCSERGLSQVVQWFLWCWFWYSSSYSRYSLKWTVLRQSPHHLLTAFMPDPNLLPTLGWQQPHCLKRGLLWISCWPGCLD